MALSSHTERCKIVMILIYSKTGCSVSKDYHGDNKSVKKCDNTKNINFKSSSGADEKGD